MVSSAEQPLRKAMAEARDAGIEKADLISMVTDVYNAPQVNDAEPAPAAEHVYDELPEGLIDVPSACRAYGLNRRTVNGWIRRGLIPKLGKLRAPAGHVNVTDHAAIVKFASQPVNPGGRPRKR